MNTEKKYYVDLFEKVKDLLVFESEDDFYYLQILQRKKDNPHIGSNSHVIKEYYISSYSHLMNAKDEIISLCHLFNARASLRLNKRSYERTAFITLEKIANTMQNKAYNNIKKCYSSACGSQHNDKNKKWIVDVDKEDLVWMEQIIHSIQESNPQGDKIIAQFDTKSGVHLITKPFDKRAFKDTFEWELRQYKMNPINIDIHGDNPINLYIPLI